MHSGSDFTFEPRSVRRKYHAFIVFIVNWSFSYFQSTPHERFRNYGCDSIPLEVKTRSLHFSKGFPF